MIAFTFGFGAGYDCSRSSWNVNDYGYGGGVRAGIVVWMGKWYRMRMRMGCYSEPEMSMRLIDGRG